MTGLPALIVLFVALALFQVIPEMYALKRGGGKNSLDDSVKCFFVRFGVAFIPFVGVPASVFMWWKRMVKVNKLKEIVDSE